MASADEGCLVQENIEKALNGKDGKPIGMFDKNLNELKGGEHLLIKFS